jgi:glycosyltransferase involved in cell wall biosynthesis
MAIRDEADIVRECLEHLATWCDAVHVLDTGSTDGTWDIIQDLARREPRIKPFDRQDIIFENDVRGMIFERVRHTFEPGDWVGRLDADEFYHIDPRQFIAEHVRPSEGRVFAQEYEFVVTQSEWDAWQRSGTPLDQPARSVVEARRAYVTDPVPEPRLFRFRRGMRWGVGHPNPFNPGLPAWHRIPVRHYRWRNPAQMQARCQLRATTVALSEHGEHWKKAELQSWIYPDDCDRIRWYDGHLEPRNDLNHLGGRIHRLAQHALYATGLVHLLDLTRNGWAPQDKPRPWVGSEASGLLP